LKRIDAPRISVLGQKQVELQGEKGGGGHGVVDSEIEGKTGRSNESTPAERGNRLGCKAAENTNKKRSGVLKSGVRERGGGGK